MAIKFESIEAKKQRRPLQLVCLAAVTFGLEALFTWQQEVRRNLQNAGLRASAAATSYPGVLII